MRIAFLSEISDGDQNSKNVIREIKETNHRNDPAFKERERDEEEIEIYLAICPKQLIC